MWKYKRSLLFNTPIILVKLTEIQKTHQIQEAPNNYPCEFMCLFTKETTLLTSISISTIEILAKDHEKAGRAFLFPLKLRRDEWEGFLRNFTNS